MGRRAPIVTLLTDYADAPPGGLLALAGSFGFVEIAVSSGSAARRLGARRGTRVEVS